MAYVVFAEELETAEDVKTHTVATLEQAFAQIVCRCGLAYHFEQESDGWRLILTDVEQPSRNPDSIFSTYKKPHDAHHDLMTQAVDGRIRGHVAVDLASIARRAAPRAELSEHGGH
jgi:hypothetical protein